MGEKKIKKGSSAKTLQTAREAGYFGKKILKNALQAREEGRPIAWSMVTWYQGDLIAKAMGVELVYPENWGAFCAAVGAAEAHLEISHDEGFPSTLCGYARNCFGYTVKLANNEMKPPDDAPGGGMPKPTVLLGSGVACDARYKWFQALGRYMEVPVWTHELPHTGVPEYFLPGNKEHNIKFMVSEMREYVTFMEKLLGKKLDWDRYSEMVDQTFRTLRLAYEVEVLRKAVPSPMVSQDFWAIMIPHYYLPEDPEAYEFYQRVYDEVKEKVDNKIGAIPNEKYRMMFSELPPWHNIGFFDEIAEKHGIAMVIESIGYHPMPPIPEEEIGGITDPLELNARLSYHHWTAYHETALKYQVEPGYQTAPFLNWVQDYKADGLFCHPLMSCRPATYTLLHLGNILMDKFKVPSVVVDGDIIDMRVFDVELAHSKVEAFVETMDHYREERNKMGLSW